MMADRRRLYAGSPLDAADTYERKGKYSVRT